MMREANVRHQPCQQPHRQPNRFRGRTRRERTGRDQSPTTLLAEPETPKPTEGEKPKDDKSLLNEETPEDKKVPDKYDFKLPDGATVDEEGAGG